jgi:hypothetical protein
MNRHPHRRSALGLALALALAISSSAAAASPLHRAPASASQLRLTLEVFVNTVFPGIWPSAQGQRAGGRVAGKEGVSIDPDGVPHAAPGPQPQPNEGGSLDPDGK